MPGWTTDGVANLAAGWTGDESASFDTKHAAGVSPETGALNLLRLSTISLFLNQNISKTMVAKTRYVIQYDVGYSTLGGASIPAGGANNVLTTGLNVLVGGTGGTDKWVAELHDVNGNVVATSNTAGITVGTANEWQQFPWYANSAATPVTIAAGTYFIAIQSNGTTATLAVYNAPTLVPFTGAIADSGGTFGDAIAITPPTAYVQADGPVATLY